MYHAFGRIDLGKLGNSRHFWIANFVERMKLIFCFVLIQSFDCGNKIGGIRATFF